MSTKRENKKAKSKGRRHHFFVNSVRYESEAPRLLGAQIKAVAGVHPYYQLLLEERGDGPDEMIGDCQAVNIKGKFLSFYAVPPATGG